MAGDVGRCREMSGDVGRCREMAHLMELAITAHRQNIAQRFEELADKLVLLIRGQLAVALKPELPVLVA